LRSAERSVDGAASESVVRQHQGAQGKTAAGESSAPHLLPQWLRPNSKPGAGNKNKSDEKVTPAERQDIEQAEAASVEPRSRVQSDMDSATGPSLRR
jgi:hypothetical protein